MISIKFEDITNHIGVLIQNDTDIQLYCQENFGNTLTVIDNSIAKREHIPQMPSCEINKDEEIAFLNEEAKDKRKSNIWTGNIVFFENFEIDDDTGELPNGAKIEINGVTTFTPSDKMRILARKIGDLLYNKIACSNLTQGIFLSNYQVASEVYYDRVSGTVASYLQFEIYKRSSAYN